MSHYYLTPALKPEFSFASFLNVILRGFSFEPKDVGFSRKKEQFSIGIALNIFGLVLPCFRKNPFFQGFNILRSMEVMMVV